MQIKELVSSNLVVLGCCVNKDAFGYANEKEFQRVMYHLFTTLNQETCKKRFHTCWPVISKQDAAQFRRVVHFWLKEIKSSFAYATFPFVNMGLLVSPGGPKMYEFLLGFTTFVMYYTANNDNSFGRSVLMKSSDETVMLYENAAELEKLSFIESQSADLETMKLHRDFSAKFAANCRETQSSVDTLSERLSGLMTDIDQNGGNASFPTDDIEGFIMSMKTVCQSCVDRITVHLNEISKITGLCDDMGQISLDIIEKFSRSTDVNTSPVTTEHSVVLSRAFVNGQLDIYLLLQLLAETLPSLLVLLKRNEAVLCAGKVCGSRLQNCLERCRSVSAEAVNLDSQLTQRLLQLQNRMEQRSHRFLSPEAIPDHLSFLLRPSASQHSLRSLPSHPHSQKVVDSASVPDQASASSFSNLVIGHFSAEDSGISHEARRPVPPYENATLKAASHESVDSALKSGYDDHTGSDRGGGDMFGNRVNGSLCFAKLSIDSTINSDAMEAVSNRCDPSVRLENDTPTPNASCSEVNGVSSLNNPRLEKIDASSPAVLRSEDLPSSTVPRVEDVSSSAVSHVKNTSSSATHVKKTSSPVFSHAEDTTSSAIPRLMDSSSSTAPQSEDTSSASRVENTSAHPRRESSDLAIRSDLFVLGTSLQESDLQWMEGFSVSSQNHSGLTDNSMDGLDTPLASLKIDDMLLL